MFARSFFESVSTYLATWHERRELLWDCILGPHLCSCHGRARAHEPCSSSIKAVTERAHHQKLELLDTLQLSSLQGMRRKQTWKRLLAKLAGLDMQTHATGGFQCATRLDELEESAPVSRRLLLGDMVVSGIIVPALIIVVLAQTDVYTPQWTLLWDTTDTGSSKAILSHGAVLTTCWVTAALATGAYGIDSVRRTEVGGGTSFRQSCEEAS